MSKRSRGKRNKVSNKARIECLLMSLNDPKVSLNPKYANSANKIKI